MRWGPAVGKIGPLRGMPVISSANALAMPATSADAGCPIVGLLIGDAPASVPFLIEFLAQTRIDLVGAAAMAAHVDIHLRRAGAAHRQRRRPRAHGCDQTRRVDFGVHAKSCPEAYARREWR
jgi:hypothetical protein